MRLLTIRHAKWPFTICFLILINVLLTASGFLAACRPFTPTPAPDRVTLQLNCSHEAEFAGYYVAEAKGFYANENIAVAIREGGFPVGVQVSQVILSRTADLAVLSSTEFRGVVKSSARPVAVMSVQQIPPVVLFALSKSGIQKPQDLVGRRVAIKSDNWRDIIRETLTNAGVDPAGIVESTHILTST